MSDTDTPLKITHRAKRLWVTYVVALSLIAAFLLASHGVASYALKSGLAAASVINESGRQRMLSQRILVFAQDYLTNGGTLPRQALETSLRQFEEIHTLLSVDYVQSNASNNTDLVAALNEVYFIPDLRGISLDDRVKSYIADGYVVLEGNSVDAHDALNRMHAVGPWVLLTQLNDVVLAFERDAELGARHLHAIQRYSLIAALTTLCLEALFIFWPAHRTAVRALKKLEMQAQVLNTAKAKLVDQNDQLAQMQKSSEYRATHDALTGLLNRRGLDEVLASYFEHPSYEKLALLHIDLDRFKQINDTMGHAAGDHVLSHVAQTLKGHLLPGEHAARVGGDEFVVVTTARTDKDALSKHADRLIEEFSKPIIYKDAVCRFGASIGIDVGLVREIAVMSSVEELLMNADMALYQAKADGRGRYAFYNASVRSLFMENQRFSNAIMRGLSRGEFVPHYQAEICARRHKLVGLQAIVRWNHPQQGWLDGAYFMPQAKALGAIVELEQNVLQSVHKDLASWRALGLVSPPVSFGLSAQSLADAGLSTFLKSLDLSPHDVLFSIGESVRADEAPTQTTTNLMRLKALGFDLEIDKFGTGASSLLSVQTLNPKRVRLDDVIVEMAVNTPDQEGTITGLIAVGSANGAHIVAEGVQAPEDVEALTKLGVDIVQGSAFGGPARADQTRSLLKADEVPEMDLIWGAVATA